MNATSLDTIVREMLMDRGLSIHWWFKYIRLASQCLEELTFDTLKLVNYKELTVDEVGRAVIPDDCVDFVKIGYGNSQILYPMINYPDFKAAPNTDDEGNVIPYSGRIYYGSYYYYCDYWEDNISIDGYDMGKRYGGGQTSVYKGFRWLPEQNVIQFSQDWAGCKVMMEYIGNGKGCGAATRITPYAKDAIRSYVAWQSSDEKDNLRSASGIKYKAAHDRLRGRLNPYQSAIQIAQIAENARAQSR